MRPLSLFFFFILFAHNLIAQKQPSEYRSRVQDQPELPTTQPYGKISQEDLDLKSCDFEKEANAEILFDKADVYQEGRVTIMQRHTRIKVFKDAGKGVGNVRVGYISFMDAFVITDLQAETINLEDGKTVVTKIDPKAAFTERVNRTKSELVFALPNVRAGSVIEYKYRVALVNGYFPDWFFQHNLPTRYSEIKTDFPAGMVFRSIPHIKQAYVKEEGRADDFTQLRALANIHSLPDEPYTDAVNDNLQRIEFLGLTNDYNTWEKIGELLAKSPNFGQQIDVNLAGESGIIKEARALKSLDDKISFIYDTVKNCMKWNGNSSFLVVDETSRAWNKKVGNSAEINLILCHLLNKVGIKACPVIVSTKKNGKLNPANPSIYILNNVAVYISIDSAAQYVLDATGKYNLFNRIPVDELNTFGLVIDEPQKVYEIKFLQSDEPALESIFINAEIKPDGEMAGSAELTSSGYDKTDALARYKTDGEEKYIKYLENNDNTLKISSLKLEDMKTDTLPLTQKINFTNELTGSDGDYIYFNTNLFTLMGKNPFLSENRFSDIDFGYRNNYSINGIYKIPGGYKTDALPKSLTLVMPDESIVFKRIVAESDGSILVKYVLNHRKALYFQKDYQDIRLFYRKMYEALNEQIVLKKS